MAANLFNPVGQQSVHDELVEYQTNIPQEEQQVPKISSQRNFVHTELPEDEEFTWRQPLFDPSMGVRVNNQSEEALNAGWGESRYDVGAYNLDEDLEDRRARSQSNGWKIANGAIKGAITAGTTAVNTVAGVIDGVLEGGFELGKEIVTGKPINPGQVFDAGVNNFVANTMLKIQNQSEEWFPNYRTEEEQSEKYQDEWYKHIFSANFIGDSFLKNFGFTVGAMGGGSVWTKALSSRMIKKLPNDLMKGVVASAEGDSAAAQKLLESLTAINSRAASVVDADVLAKNITEAAKAINKMQAKLQLSGSVIAAMGEGLVEGNMAKNEFTDDYTAQLTKQYIDLNNNLEQEVLAENEKYRRSYIDENGETQYELNDMGLARLQERQEEMANKYSDTMRYAKQEADRLASTTFFLNLPILTISNTVQFGRMFAGGWKTSRNALSRVGGKMTFAENGAPLAAFRGRGNAVIGGVANSLKVAGTEAAEEMLQGYASSGAKYVADTRLTAFNDDGYDKNVMRAFGSWLKGIDEGGWEYLSDTKNWQEGFMGAITGLMGIPGRRWAGGVPEAIRDAKEKVNASRVSAQALNDRINSPEFRNQWLGYTRHQKYDQELLNASINDDEYAWHGADDKMLINDVIMFADAGRLNDLYELADRFSSMSEQDAEALGVLDMVKNEDNENEVDNDPQASTQKVIDKASDIKEVIQQYKDNYDAIRAIMPIGTSEEQIKEMLFTSMQIKRFERRYLEMANDVLEKLEPLFKRQDELDELQEKKQELVSLRDSMNKILTGDVFTNLESLVLRNSSNKLLNELENLVSEDSELNTQLKDMRRLMEDRRAFYDKIVALKNMKPETFNAKAKNDTSVKQDADREETKAEIEALNTVEDVKNAVFSQEYGERRNKYVESLNRVRGEKQVVDDFLKLYSTSRDFSDFFIHQNMRLLTPLGDEALNYLFNEKLNKLNGVSSEQEYLDFSDDILPSLDEFIKSREESGRATQRPQSREVYEASYNEAINMLRGMLNDFAKLRNKHRATQAKRPVVYEQNSMVGRLQQRFASVTGAPQITPDAPNPGSQAVIPEETKPVAKIAEDKKSATDAMGRTWTIGETVYGYRTDDEGYADSQREMTITGFEKKGDNVFIIAKDENNRTRKPSIVADVQYLHKEPAKQKPAIEAKQEQPIDAGSQELKLEAVNDINEKEPEAVVDGEEKNKYRLGVPQVDSFEAKTARDAAHEKDIAKFAKADLRDMPQRNPAFGESWNAVNDRGGFRNTVTKVKTGDKVKFVIDKTFPPYDNEYQILVYTEKGDFLNTLPRKGYDGIEELWKAINDEYKAAGEPDTFTFSKMSTVWYRPKGLIRYDYSEGFSGERSLMDAGYDATRDKDVPIVYYDKDGKAYNARTKRRRSLDDDPALAGRIYYVVEGGDGEQYRIRLGIEHYKNDNWDYNDNPRIAAIRQSANKIEKSFRELLESNAQGMVAAGMVKATNREMHEELANLKKNLDIVDLVFNVVDNNGQYELQIAQTDNSNNVLDAVQYPLSELAQPDAFAKYLGEFKRALNVDFNTIGSELDNLISTGTLTTNTDSLMPVGADCWMAHWENGDFVLTDKQKEIMNKITKETPAAEVTENGQVTQPETAPQPEQKVSKTVRPKVVAVKTGAVTPEETTKAQSLDAFVKPFYKKFETAQKLTNPQARAVLNLAAQGPIAVGKYLNGTRIDESSSLADNMNALLLMLNSIFTNEEKEKIVKAWDGIFKKKLTGYNLFLAFQGHSSFQTSNPTITYVLDRMHQALDVDMESLLHEAQDMIGVYDERFKTSDIGSASLEYDELDKSIQDDIIAMLGDRSKYDGLDYDQKAEAVLRCLGVA